LIVFDEAHHLTASESGNKVRKTQNFKLAESMREHSRDLLLLSATPHQGDHFRFWMLIRLLDPRLFENTDDMVENRHRLNAVVYRRTQADACDANGDPLFARRQVHTSAFRAGVRLALGFAPDAGMGPASGPGRLLLNTRNGRGAAQGPNLTPRSPRRRVNQTRPGV